MGGLRVIQTVQLYKRELQNIKQGEHLSTQQPQEPQQIHVTLLNSTSVAKAMKVLRKLRCLQIEVGIVQSLCRNDCHQVILLGQVLEIVE